MKVDVYRNLNRRGVVWSVKSRQKPKYGIVIDRPSSLLLKGVQLVVSEAGRQRCLRTKRRNVHAFARAEDYVSEQNFSRHDKLFAIKCKDMGDKIRYNPYLCSSFETVAGQRIETADLVFFDSSGDVFALAPII